MARQFFDKRRRNRLIGRLLGRYIRLVASTSRCSDNLAANQAFLRGNQPYILAMWHGQFMLLAAYAPRDVPVSNMVARHGDAEIIGEALKTFDMGLVRGGGAAGRRKDRGGLHAFREALRLLDAGTSVAMTADVPPGPARRAGDGIVRLAQRSGRPIIPVAIASSRYHALDTWSRMTINLPFSRIGVALGTPVIVPANADSEALRLAREEVEASLNIATNEAYVAAGANARDVLPAAALSTQDPPARSGVVLRAYRGATRIFSPALPFILAHRERIGKSDPNRRNEQLGRPVIKRPPGELIWLHAASVGETNAVLPLIESLKARRPTATFLLTTGTVTSAELAETRLQTRCIHQYAPLDAPGPVRRFLDHWRPDLGCLTESEIWPNTILEAHTRGIPLALINARLSDRSYRRWRKNRSLARPLFSRMRLILAQNERLARRFRELGGRNVIAAGNLKVDAPSLPVDFTALEDLRHRLGTRPVWLAASTHPGEETIIFDAIPAIKRQLPNALLVLAPRHPERGTELEAAARARGLSVACRTATAVGSESSVTPAELNETMSPGLDVYIANTVGELGLFYSAISTAFIGGSLIPHGGQNPIEAIRLDCGVITGPSQFNFADAHDELRRCNGIIEVSDAQELASQIIALLTEPARNAQLVTNAHTALDAMIGALTLTTDALDQLISTSKPTQTIGATDSPQSPDKRFDHAS